MDGFARSVDSDEPMGYWTEDVLPFAYSFARTFPLANRWFCSAPCQTYPNRRFLMAGTAYGDIATSTESLSDPPPPNGTIFDRLHAYGISWRNYFTDLPQTAIIPSIIEKYPAQHLARSPSSLADCKAGNAAVGELRRSGVRRPRPISANRWRRCRGLEATRRQARARPAATRSPRRTCPMASTGPTRRCRPCCSSPAWPRTLLVYTYDEHGGYYDHVPPPAAIAPDSIPPDLGSGDVPGGYDIYGPRVPGIVASPYSKPNAVTNVVHDHTSVLATIEAKWNLPALTYRDANARTVADFLDVQQAAFMEPPTITEPPVPVEAIASK